MSEPTSSSPPSMSRGDGTLAQPGGVRGTDLGRRIREGRRHRKLTLQQLANQVNISASHISQIERGIANPSVSSLLGIAGILELPMEFFFQSNPTARSDDGVEGAERPGFAEREGRHHLAPVRTSKPDDVTRELEDSSTLVPVVNPENREIIRVEGGIEWRRLTPAHDDTIVFLELLYEVGASDGEFAYRHRGREYGVVTQGTLKVEVGFSTYVLGPGDSISFDCGIPHKLTNAGQISVTAIWVVVDRY